MPRAARGLQVVFGRRVRAFRKNAGLSQRDVAEAAGIDLKYFGGIERGRKNVTLATVQRIARVLGVEAHELLAPGDSVARAEVPDADRFAALIERLDVGERETMLKVLEGFARYRRRRTRR